MITSLTDLFFPRACAGCGAFLLHSENVICASCRHAIPLTNHFSNPENEAATKFYGKVPIEFAGAFMYYHKHGIVQELIRNLKYKGQECVGNAIAEWLSSELIEKNGFRADAVIPVPLHPRKLQERGYNQVASFGKTIARRLNISYDDKLLVRNYYSKTQTRKNLLGRTEIGKDKLFGVNVLAEPSKHYLLVDDVLTTGSTLEACCRALLEMPTIKISIVCMAMSHS